LISFGLLACGGNSVHHLTDAGGDAAKAPDAAPDAAPTTGVVTVTVTLGGSGVAAVPVYFQNADSSVVSDTTTDGSGVASATMRAGGFVTIIEPTVAVTQPAASVGSVTNATLLTWSGVKPGDNLRDDLDPVTPANVPSTINITAPVDSNAAVTSYQLVTTCGTSALNGPVVVAVSPDLTPTTVTLDNCNGTADMLVEGLGSGGVVVDTLFAPGIAVGSGSGSGLITLSGTYAAVTAQAFSFTDIPPEIASVALEDELATGHGALTSDGEAAVVGSNGTGSATLPAVVRGTGVVAGYEYIASPAGSIDDAQRYTQWGPEPASVDVDLGSLALRHWETAPQVDTVSEAVTWAAGSTGATPDYFLTEVRADRTGSGSAGTSTWTWVVAAGSGAEGNIPFPTVPTDVFDFNFKDTDELTVDGVGGVQNAGGYDAVRANVLTLFVEQLDEPLGFITTAGSGALTTQVTKSVAGNPAVTRKPWPHAPGVTSAHLPTVRNVAR
jgi:hypothetical protein